ncbi:MAG: hypothetical protein CMO40_05275, partial [Verrucomicrobiaceae bacterium]|nr:hypothetical protein [Verrucomicrobiaceae bacterium]
MKTHAFLVTAVTLAIAGANLPAQNLLVDFSSTSQGGGPNLQVGYQAYDAGHEAIADFVTRSYPAFG